MGVLSSGIWLYGGGSISGASPTADWWWRTSPFPAIWGMGYDGVTHVSLLPKSGVLTGTFPTNALAIDGVFVDEFDIPTGFTPRDAWEVWVYGLSGPGAGFASLQIAIPSHGVSEVVDDWTVPPASDPSPAKFPQTGMTRLALLGFGGFPITFDAAIPDQDPSTGWPGHLEIRSWAVAGTYDIVAYWWTIPAISVCGVRADSHLTYGSDDPGAPWVRLDPDDPDAAPVPVITSIQPDHGVVGGGTAIEIHGSGFGDACTVAIDGVPATSVVVVSQHLITCLTPAHVAGSVDVVVTNEDGATT